MTREIMDAGLLVNTVEKEVNRTGDATIIAPKHAICGV
jgi:hypothetical protein